MYLTKTAPRTRLGKTAYRVHLSNGFIVGRVESVEDSSFTGRTWIVQDRLGRTISHGHPTRTEAVDSMQVDPQPAPVFTDGVADFGPAGNARIRAAIAKRLGK